MKKFIKLTALVLTIMLVLPLSACNDANKVSEAAYSIGICQLVQHDAHNDATQGFMDALNETLPNQVVFNVQNASNEIPLCTSIVNQFIAEEVDLILANATPALQAASAATDDIPILGTSVTDYAIVMGIDDFNGVVGGNVSGTSDLASLDAQAKIVAEWFPDAINVGLLYCSAESNSQFQVDGMNTKLENLGYTCKYYAFTDANDLPSVLEGAIANCDLLYVPTDNTVAACSAIIDNYCRPAKLPVIGGDEGICSSCTVATHGVNYYDLGYKTGLMAAKVLTGEADISTMPIEYADCSHVYNAEICAELGITPPDGYAVIGA